MSIRLLALPDLDALVAHLMRHAGESGRGGTPVFGPHPRGRQPDAEVLRARRRTGWQAPPTRAGWERAWGLFVDGTVVGHAELHGGKLETELHRATLGVGLEASHRGAGHGEQLVRAAIGWMRQLPHLSWLDLGVFEHNGAARALYERLGFREVGRVEDRFRVDGQVVCDIQMTLEVRGFST